MNSQKKKVDIVNNDTTNYDKLPIPKLNMSELDAHKITTLQLTMDDNKLLLFIYFYLQLSGLYESKHIFLMSLNILAQVKHTNSNINVTQFKHELNKFFSNCTISQIDRKDSETSETTETTDTHNGIKNKPKENIYHMINDTIQVLTNVKKIINQLQKNISIPLEIINDIINNTPTNKPIPSTNQDSLMFSLYLYKINYSMNTDHSEQKFIIDLHSLYTKCSAILDSNITILKNIITLHTNEVTGKIRELKQQHTKSLEEIIEQNRTTDHTENHIENIITMFSQQCNQFISNIPLYSKYNIYERQLYLQKKIKTFLMNMHYLIESSPFVVHINIFCNIIKKQYSIELNCKDIVNILDYKTNNNFTIDLFNKQLIQHEIQEYNKKDTNTDSVNMSQTIQQLIYGLYISIYNNILPTFNIVNQSQNIHLQKLKPTEKLSSLKDTMQKYVCEHTHSDSVTKLIQMIQSADNSSHHSIQTFMKGTVTTINDIVTNNQMCIIKISSKIKLHFIRILDLCLSICTKGVIYSLGMLPNTITFDDIKKIDSVVVKESISSHEFTQEIINNSVQTSYYIESSCTQAIIQYLLKNVSRVSKNIIKIEIVYKN